MACKNDGQNLAVLLLSTALGVAAVVGMLFVVIGDRSDINEIVTDEPAEGVRWQVTQKQRADGIKIRVLEDLQNGREYLIVDWGEGTGVTALLPPAESLSTGGPAEVTVPADFTPAGPDE